MAVLLTFIHAISAVARKGIRSAGRREDKNRR
jgi:hypothetical protein